MPVYSKPPITEAVIELRTDEVYDARDLERCRDRLKREYARVEPQTEVNINVDEVGAVTHQSKVIGFKLTAANAVDVVLVNAAIVATSRLAPYINFELLLESTRQNVETVAKLVGRRRISRIGVRFVNRIDVPDAVFETSGKWPGFVKVMPALPADVMRKEDCSHFMNIHANYASNRDIRLVIQGGMLNPVLLNHQSFQLDIDVAFDRDIPQRFDEVWERLATLRAAKNHIFESCITDAARELFK